MSGYIDIQEQETGTTPTSLVGALMTITQASARRTRSAARPEYALRVADVVPVAEHIVLVRFVFLHSENASAPQLWTRTDEL